VWRQLKGGNVVKTIEQAKEQAHKLGIKDESLAQFKGEESVKFMNWLLDWTESHPDEIARLADRADILNILMAYTEE
jgi:trans-aconitate methyltransferase